MGQVGGSKGREVVGVEAGGTVNDLERRSRELGHVGNGHVGDPGETGEADIETDTVGLDVEVVAQAAELAGEDADVPVVVEIHLLDGGELDGVEGLNGAVADGNLIGLGQGAKLHGPQEGNRAEVDSASGLQRGEVDIVKLLQAFQGELAANGLDAAAAESLELSGILDSEISRDLLRAGEVDGASSSAINHEVSLDDLAAAELASVGLVGDSGALGGDSACR